MTSAPASIATVLRNAALLALLAASPALAQSPPSATRAEVLERDGIVWGSAPVWNAPFAPDLPQDLKLAGLGRVWMEAKINFPNFARVPDLDWDKTYLDFIPQVLKTTSTYDYYLTLQRMVALLHDGHTGVFLPTELEADSQADVPLQLELIEERVFITRVSSHSLLAAGIKPGLEVLQVDGMPVKDYALQHRTPFRSSNSPQHRDVQVYSYGLLAGPRERPVAVQLRRPSGQVFDWTFARGRYADTSSAAHVEYRRLDHNLAYVAVNTFNAADVLPMFEKLMPELRTRDGIILDVRQNDGGSGALAYDLIAELTDKPFAVSAARTRRYTLTLRVWGQPGEWYAIPVRDWSPKPHPLSKPIVLLIGPKSVSATDVFVETFQRLRLGRLVGEPTAGSIGDPLVFALPGGGAARVATSTDLPGGLVGRGVQPDLFVPRTVTDLLAGRDAAIERGSAELIAMVGQSKRPDHAVPPAAWPDGGHEIQRMPPSYDSSLAARLGANARGMKHYVLALIRTGPKTDLTPDQLRTIFIGHQANIKRLVAAGTLVLAGPFAENERGYEGIFIFNATNPAEVAAIMKTDPAVAAGRFVYDAVDWYGSAAIQEVTEMHQRIDKIGLYR